MIYPYLVAETTKQLIHCGGDRIIFVPYTDSDDNIYGSQDDGETWTTLIDTATGAVRHNHAGYYQTNSLGEIFVLMSGDSSTESAIVYTTNVASLFLDPGAWKTNWGLHFASPADRLLYLSVTNTTWCVDTGSQRARTVNVVGDDNLNLWWIPDGQLYAGGQTKWSFSDKSITVFRKTGTIGWSSVRLSNGLILMDCVAERFSGSYGTSTPYARLYTCEPRSAGLMQVAQRAVIDFGAPEDGTKRTGLFAWTDVNGIRRVIWTPEYTQSHYRGTATYQGTPWVGRVGADAIIESSPGPVINYVTNGDLTQPFSAADWSTNASTLVVSEETSIVDSAYGKTKSFKLEVSGTASNYMQQELDAVASELAGGWVTFAARFYGALAGQSLRVSLIADTYFTSGYSKVWSAAPATPDNTWWSLQLPFYVPAGTTTLDLRIAPRSSSSSETNTLYVSDIRLVNGNVANALGPSPLLPVNFQSIFAP